MSRPYFNNNITQLEKIFAENCNDVAILSGLLDELEHRKTNKAKQLCAQINEQLNNINTQGSKTSARKISKNDPPLKKCPPTKATPKKPATNVTTSEFPDDRMKPSVFLDISAPGIAGKPDAYQPVLKSDLKIDVPPNSSNAHRFVLALDALIKEMRQEGSGSRRYELENGKLVDRQGTLSIYGFPFPEDAEIFEEARIEVDVNGARTAGQVVSISDGAILVALDNDLGTTVRHCILLIDNTALLETLKDRLDQAENGELKLSIPLADSVISSRVKTPGSSPTPLDIPVHKLNQNQNSALELMLKRNVSYLWGPPGTGKTHTLAVLIQSAFDAGKRILVCSNTNQAVDQLILKLCERLKEVDPPSLNEGKIVRAGNIVLPELMSEFASFVTIDGITERLSEQLREKQTFLEKQIQRIDTSAAPIENSLQLFSQLEETESEHSSRRAKLASLAKVKRITIEARDQTKNQLENLKTELDQWQRAGTLRRVFLRSQEKIGADSQYRKSTITQQETKIGKIGSRAKALDGELEDIWKKVLELRRRVSGKVRSDLETQKQALSAERQPLVAELQNIASRLAEIEASILHDAQVIGTTVAKSYLRASDLGKFDLVIIDEASMVLLPALYICSGMSTERVVIPGDFRQLPPIIPSKQEAISELIGHDVFSSAKIDGKANDPRCAMLEIQYRMTEEICSLIANDMYQGKLTTAKDRQIPEGSLPPAPYDSALTIIDTSRLWPFESKNVFKSRFNLMNAILVRNLVGHLASTGFLKNSSTLGVCTPYAAQAKLLKSLLGDIGDSSQFITAGTVHRYQGDEKRMMILDIPESIGPSWGIGLFVQGVPPDHIGARLLNVAVSRAQEQLVIVANLTYLENKLPSTAFLRSVLHRAQSQGQVIDASEIMALRPVEADLKELLGIVELDLDAKRLGLFHTKSFSDACLFDLKEAKHSIVIYSGFSTPVRVATYGELFRVKIAEGVSIRCVTRPPQFNGTIPAELGRQALDALEALGVVVDCRKKIHEKIVIIDNRIVWSGSLNPLSHTSRTDEFMTRVISASYAEQVAAFVSKRSGIPSKDAAAKTIEAENPRCPNCDSRTYYADGRYGPYFTCEREADCGWKQNARQASRKAPPPMDPSLPKEGPSCPKCNGPTTLKNGKYGAFYSCNKYPGCKGTAKIDNKRRKRKT